MHLLNHISILSPIKFQKNPTFPLYNGKFFPCGAMSYKPVRPNMLRLTTKQYNVATQHSVVTKLTIFTHCLQLSGSASDFLRKIMFDDEDGFMSFH